VRQDKKDLHSILEPIWDISCVTQRFISSGL
jgi:hypothetical protein